MRIQFPGLDLTTILYPAGEYQVRLPSETINAIHASEIIEIDARISSAAELVQLVLLSSAIRGVKPGVTMTLNIPYLPYARADRRFVDGDCHGIQVFGDILRTCRFSHINVLDVHNQTKALSHVSSFMKNHDPLPLINRAIADFRERSRSSVSILLPDAGARLRFLSQDHRIIYAEKHRDAATGKLSGFTVPSLAGHEAIMIVDDICDGGGTFIGIAEEIRKQTKVPLGLYVTHGIFSAGFTPLLERFEHIYTTDSFIEREPTSQLTVYDAFEAIR